MHWDWNRISEQKFKLRFEDDLFFLSEQCYNLRWNNIAKTILDTIISLGNNMSWNN